MNLAAWERLLSDLRIWRDKVDKQKKEVEEYELFECHKRVFSANEKG